MNIKSGTTKISTTMFVPHDLITEIISLLPVKPLVRFKCVSNSWNTLISDPTFVKFHLKKSKSSPNPQFTLITKHYKLIAFRSAYDFDYDCDWSIITYPISRLIDNPSATFVADSYHLLNNKYFSMVGSCNGLICLVHNRITFDYLKISQEFSFRLWNPATRKISQEIGYFRESTHGFVFTFGCDESTDTFKVVAYRFIGDGFTSDVRVFTIGENVWRKIESFPAVPFGLDERGQCITEEPQYGCVFLNSTLNWLASLKYIDWEVSVSDWDFTVEDLVIVSLDLGTETYSQYRLPHGFDEIPPKKPTIGVLEECLCLCYSYKGTDIVIWQMKKFGVEESWIQFLKISYHVLQLNYDISFLPLFLSPDGDTLVLCSSKNEVAILYNLRDNSMRRIEVKVHKPIVDDGTYNTLYLSLAQGYVESLISIC
ncbi:hypothetical protein RYX36_011670 [Vicia faba]